MDSDRKNLSTKVEESVLLSMVKKKYQDLNTQYESKCAENKVLKANIKLIKLNEFEIENAILKEELDKLNSLYKLMVEEKKNATKEFDEFKEQFLIQHARISQLQNQIESLNDENNKLKEEKDDIERYYENYINKQKKLKQTKNLRILIQQKNKEKDQIKKIEELMESEKKLKTLCKKLHEEKDSLKRQYMSRSPQKEKNKNSHIEIENETKTNEKFELYKSLYKESKSKNDKYERYFKDHKVNPEEIINRYNSGILNSQNKVVLYARDSSNNNLKSSTKKTENTKENKKENKLKFKLSNRNTVPNNSKTIDINLISNNNNNYNINEEEDKK